MNVSVIIPHFEQPTALRRCLAALSVQTHHDFEVVVVDNGSRHVPDALVAEHGATLVHEPEVGSYAARNRGLAHAKHDVIAFTDADCVPAPDWLARGVAHLVADPSLGLVAGRVILTDPDPRHPTAVGRYERLVHRLDQADYVRHGFAATANIFTTRAVFDAVGTFRSELRSSGDHEWSTRVAARYPIAFAPDAVVTHDVRDSLAALIRKERRLEGGRFDLRRLRGEPLHALVRELPGMLRPRVDMARTWMTKADIWVDLPQTLEFIGLHALMRVVHAVERTRLLLGQRASRS